MTTPASAMPKTGNAIPAQATQAAQLPYVPAQQAQQAPPQQNMPAQQAQPTPINTAPVRDSTISAIVLLPTYLGRSSLFSQVPGNSPHIQGFGSE